MIRFPNEHERSAEVRKNLASAFDLAEALLGFWYRQPKDAWIAKTTISWRAANLAMILDVQACRLLRSVIEECQRCEGHNASILARSLFETVLAVAFLLIEDVRIIVAEIQPKGGQTSPQAQPKFCAKASSKGVRRTKKHRLSRELRADLYAAHQFFRLSGRDIDSVDKHAGQKRRATTLRKSVDPVLVVECEKGIGPEWTYILRHHPHTYSGLKIEDLAKVLGKSFQSWYETIYHFQSLPVHAADLLKHIDLVDANTARPKFLSWDAQVYYALRTAITMFLVHILLLHGNIGFGPDVDTAYDSFKRKIDRLSYDPDGAA
jgi:hypothetical protein